MSDLFIVLVLSCVSASDARSGGVSPVHFNQRHYRARPDIVISGHCDLSEIFRLFNKATDHADPVFESCCAIGSLNHSVGTIAIETDDWGHR